MSAEKPETPDKQSNAIARVFRRAAHKTNAT
jgi:hypothetical protein